MSGPVIVGWDGSASSCEAVVVAAREASLRAVALGIVHATARPAVHLPSSTAPRNSAGHASGLMAYGMLADAEEQARAAAPGIEVFHAVVTGTPLAVLEDESRHAALAVLASRGHSRFTHRLGSTAAHLAAHGHCPLMVVRGRSAPTGPVLLAVGGSPTGRKAVEFAFTEAALRKAPLLALHVWNTWSERAYEGPGDPLNAMVTDIGHLREAEQHLLAESVTPWQEAFPQVTVEQRLVRSRIRPALIDASREAQLVVAGSRGHGALHGLLLGSVSQVLLHHSRCPVAVVHGMQ